MVDRSRVTRRAALGLVGSGALLAISETFGFSTAAAPRGVSVSTADDANALLSIEGTADETTPITLTNRSDDLMRITLDSPDDIEFDVGDDGTSDGASPTFDLLAGDAVDVDLLGDGTVTVVVDANLRRDGAVVGNVQFERQAQAQSQSGQVQITPSVKSAGNSGKYEFGLENTGDIDVTIEAIGIRETTEASAVEVSGGAILSAEGQSVVSSPIPVDSSSPDQDTRVDFDQTVSLTTSEGEKLFTFERFKTGNGKNARMKGDDVRIVLYFTDGSSSVEDLCLDGCSF